jgi:hypothetical protein
MTATSPFAKHEPAIDPSQETEQLLAAPVGDRCSVCNALLAEDQRYCVNCGERRGKPRFSLTDSRASAARAAAAGPAGPRFRSSASMTLVAGIATLLLAMGVGVLIGRSGNSPSQKQGSVQFVPTPTAAASAATTPAVAATPTVTAAKPTRAVKTAKPTAPTTAPVTAPTVKNLPPPTVTVGAAGHGAGYQNGHFTGNFFGN